MKKPLFVFIVFVFLVFITSSLAHAQSSSLWANRNSIPSQGDGDGYRMVWHSGAQKIIVYDGKHPVCSAPCATLPQMWAYDYTSNAWTNLNPPFGPGPLDHFPMAYDSRSNRIILLSKWDGGTWAYDYGANTWVNRNPAVSPQFINHHAGAAHIAYDSESDRTILVMIAQGISETWAYNYAANTWTNMNPPAPKPNGHWTGMAHMIYVPNHDRVLLIANEDNRLWAYDYNTNTWSQRAIAPSRTAPNPGPSYFMAYDSESDKVLWYGDDRVTWVYDWNTDSWTNLNASPSPGFHHGDLLYISTVDRVIVYSVNLQDYARSMWEFNYNAYAGGATPSPAPVPPPPPPAPSPTPVPTPTPIPPPAPSSVPVPTPPPSTSGRVFYVDKNHSNCNDAGSGTSDSLPWCTLHRAMDGVPSRERDGIAGTFTPVGAGDTVWVKNGTYEDIEAYTSGRVAYRPANSGTASQPIAFRAYTPLSGERHRPVLLWAGLNRAVAGVRGGQNDIIWDGFAIGSQNHMEVWACTGCIIENMLIDPGSATWGGGATGLYRGIHLENNFDVIVRNNVIRNSYYLDHPGDANGACIMMYHNTRTRIHNNDISNCTAGIYPKADSVSDIYELNYIHDIRPDGQAFLFNNFGARDVENNIIRNNVIVNAPAGIAMGVKNERNNQFYNNTMYNVDNGIGVSRYPILTPSLLVYNNSVVRSNASGWWQTHYGYNDWHHTDPDVPPDLLSDYSHFYGITGPQARFNPYGVTETLAQWRSRGLDLNSLTADPLFVGPFTGTPAPEAFKLSASSPLRNAGRTGGISSGSLINIGAYAIGNEIIGLSSSQVFTLPPAPTPVPVPAPVPTPSSSGSCPTTRCFYVDQQNASCTDAGPGTESQPWCTLQRAMQGDIVAGDTVWVKDGMYNAGSTNFRPANNGTTEAPIAFRRYPGHTPTVTNDLVVEFGVRVRAPALLISTDYIIVDGLTFAPGHGLDIYSCDGCVIEHNTIAPGPTPTCFTSDNYVGIFAQQNNDLIVRNNVITDVYYGMGCTQNYAGIMLYSSPRAHIHHNRFGNNSTGIFVKEAGQETLIEQNYIHDSLYNAILIGSNAHAPRCGECLVQNNIIRNNVIVNAPSNAIRLGVTPSLVSGTQIYNNTIYHASYGIVGSNSPDQKIYNNIIHSSSGTRPHLSAYNNQTSGALTNYNDFHATSGSQARFEPVLYGASLTLSQWQASPYLADLNSLAVDPLFVDPLTGTRVPDVFKLSASSPLRNAGRVGGISSGSPVTIGAYVTGNEIIGLSSSQVFPFPPPPSPLPVPAPAPTPSPQPVTPLPSTTPSPIPSSAPAPTPPPSPLPSSTPTPVPSIAPVLPPSSPATSIPPSASAGSSPSLPSIRFTRPLTLSSKGDGVKALQEILIAKGYLKQGNNTGYFGPLTEAAVKKFQTQKNIVSSGAPQTTGYGNVGPQTREKLNEIISSEDSAAQTSTPPSALSEPERQVLIKELTLKIQQFTVQLLQLQVRMLEGKIK